MILEKLTVGPFQENCYVVGDEATGTGVLFDPGDEAARIALAVGVFALFALFMALGQMGGGDVKLGGALVLWLRPSEVVPFLVHTALVGGVVTIATILWHRLARRPGPPEVPYGLAIVAGALVAFTQRYLNHFA